MAIQFITKYFSEYISHKRKACYWSIVGDIIPLLLIFHNSYCFTCGSQSYASFISRVNCNYVAILSWQDVNAFILYSCSPSVPGAFQFFTVYDWCFFASLFLLFVSNFFNHFTASLCITGWSHISLQDLKLSWLPSLMSLLLFSISSLSNNFAWFVWNILPWIYCSVLASYLLSLDDVPVNLCFSSSITTFSTLSFTFCLFPSWSLVASIEFHFYSIDLNG